MDAEMVKRLVTCDDERAGQIVRVFDTNYNTYGSTMKWGETKQIIRMIGRNLELLSGRGL